MNQATPRVIETSSSLVSNRANGSVVRLDELRAVKAAARQREEKMRKSIVLPELSKELGYDFSVTIKRGSMTDLALAPDAPSSAIEYVSVFIEQMNKAAFEFARKGVDFSNMTEEETQERNRELGLKTTESTMLEFGGVEYERKRRDLADAFCLIFVVDPEVVPSEDDIDPRFEGSQISLDMIPASDRLFIQTECQTQEDDAIKRDLKSVSAEGDESKEPDAGVGYSETGAPIGVTAAAGGDAEDATGDPGRDVTDRSGDEPFMGDTEPAVLAGDGPLRRDGERVRAYTDLEGNPGEAREIPHA